MRNQKGLSLISFIIIVVLVILAISFFPRIFGHTTEQVAKETQKLIEEEWQKEGINYTILEDMSLVKKDRNEYSGMMKIRVEGIELQLTGTVICDGDMIQWQPDRENLIYQMLY